MSLYLNMSKLKELNSQWFAKGNKKLFGDVSYKLVYGKRTGERYFLRSTNMWSDMFGRQKKLVYRINFIKDNGKIGSLVDIIFSSLSSANEWLKQN